MVGGPTVPPDRPESTQFRYGTARISSSGAGKWEIADCRVISSHGSRTHVLNVQDRRGSEKMLDTESPGLGVSDGYWGNAVNGFAWFSPQEHKWHIAITSGDDLIFFDLSKKDNDDVSILKSTDVEA